MSRRAGTAALCVLLAGCAGMGDANQEFPDGGVGADARPGCRVSFTVGPTSPVAPITLTATAAVVGQTGVYTLAWHVTGPSGEVTTTPLDGAGLRVSFPAAKAGPYSVSAVVQGALSCLVTPAVVNVSAAGAKTLALRLRYTPMSSQGAPPQIDPTLVQIVGGADLALAAPRILDGGAVARGQVMGPAGGLGAYLRLESASAGVVEVFADSAGAYEAHLPFSSYKALVVPYGAGVPPKIYTSITPTLLGNGFTLEAGDALGGTVRDAGGAPVAGARVAIGNGELPPTVVVTDGSGAFAAHARLSYGALEVTVVPPAPYARHESVLTTAPAAGASLDVRLSSAELVPMTSVLRDSSGAAAPGSRATFISGAISPGGTLALNGGAPVTGSASVRTSVVAGEGGLLPDVRLPRASYTVIIEPPAGRGDVAVSRSFDLTGEAPPASLASAAPVQSAITVKDGAAAVVAGARVVAVASGISGAAAGAAVAATSGSNGVAVLPLAPGLPYTLTVDAPAARRLARARATLTGGAAATVTMAAAIQLSGSVIFAAGSGQPGVRVEALCADCDDPLPLAETVTEAAGQFSLLLPDPGVSR